MDMQTNNEYGVKVAMLINDSKYRGIITEEEARGLGASLFTYSYGDASVGYMLTFYWAVNTTEDTVVLARYTYEGVSSGVAVNYMLALMFTNKTIAQIDTVNYQVIERLLRDNPTIEALPSSENYSIVFGIDAAKRAVKVYTNQALSHDEKTFPCKDTPLSLAALKDAIKTHNIQNHEALVAYTKAGSVDISCNEILNGLIEAHKVALKEQEEADSILSATPFEELCEEGRIIAIDTAIDNTVRQFLIMDGGDIDVLSVKEKGDEFEVYISYLGACSSCSSSGSGTLIAIENALKHKLHPNIRVIPI